MQRKERKMERASFFKVMIGDFAEKMQIPMQFVLDSGRELCSIDVAILNGPRRTGWRVGLKVEDGRMFFRHGWREFIKHHDIQEGYFLVFKYNGKSHFDVEVFDKSACLKKYDSYDLRGDPIEIRRSQPSNPMKRKKSSSESSNFEVLVSEDNQEIQPGKRLKAEKEVFDRKSSHFNPNNYHFKAVINRSNVMKPYMCIPKKFTLTNDLTIGRTMTLRDSEQRLWTVTIDRQRYSCSTYFRSGWTQFAVANGMKVGDVCFFDIVPSMKDVMDVRIGRRATKVKNAQFGF
ncbi:B3 domain-containing protein Os03g0212300-like [Magnolia sinica]|uniref:B3 domain-containing protein Os03g0212300-like n=1 Tax=Magnolia sinica TaxID=86752 RepID=UPI00265931E5|nr:B3 domain-containing protein Os03g0212300-like [Magnolia sinica]